MSENNLNRIVDVLEQCLKEFQKSNDLNEEFLRVRKMEADASLLSDEAKIHRVIDRYQGYLKIIQERREKDD